MINYPEGLHFNPGSSTVFIAFDDDETIARVEYDAGSCFPALTALLLTLACIRLYRRWRG